MLKVDRQSGRFTPHAPLNRVPSGCSTGVESVTNPLGQNLFHWGLHFQHEVFLKSSTSTMLVELFYVYLIYHKKNSAERYNLNLNSAEGTNSDIHRIQCTGKYT